jgi:hypothetical protein
LYFALVESIGMKSQHATQIEKTIGPPIGS